MENMKNEVQCECGEIMGEACSWSGSVEETCVVEHMPEQHRASHEAARNRGTYPHNGAVRLRLNEECAESLVDGDWTVVIGGEAEAPPLFRYSGPAEGTLRLSIEVPLEFLRDQYVSGVDGGIRYWCESATPAHVVVNREGAPGSKKARTHTLDWERAVRLAIEKYPRILDPGNMDAETGDMWIQLAAFGDIVYG